MEVKTLGSEKNELKLKVSSNEESLFMLLKGFLEDNKDVDIVGVSKDHYLIDETEFYLRVNKGDAKEVFTKTLADVKKQLEGLKIK